MKKEFFYRIPVWIMAVILPAAAALIPEPAAGWIRMLLLPLFSALLSSVACGALPGFLTGLAGPLLVYFSFGEADLITEILPVMAASAAGGFAAGLLYNRLHTAFGSAFGGLTMYLAFYGLSRMAAELYAGRFFTLEQYISEGIVHTLPGIFLSLVGLPLLIAFFRKKGVMMLLRHESNDR